MFNQLHFVTRLNFYTPEKTLHLGLNYFENFHHLSEIKFTKLKVII